MFSNSVKLLTVFIQSSPKLFDYYDHYLELYQIYCLSPHHLVVVLGFYLVTSSATSTCPSCYLYFYVCGRLGTFSALEK